MTIIYKSNKIPEYLLLGSTSACVRSPIAERCGNEGSGRLCWFHGASKV